MLGQAFAEFTDRRMQIDRRHMLQFADLLPDLLDDMRMAMTDRHAHDSGERIEISLPPLVPDILHMSFDDHQRFPIIGEQARRQVFPAQSEYFFAAWSVVRGGLVIADRQ